MTLDEKRVKLAEALGWSNFRPMGDYLYAYPPQSTTLILLPNWPEDLNACHEAEKVIIEALETPANDFRRREWRRILKKICGYTYSEHATAIQRFNALGITLGLWKEGE